MRGIAVAADLSGAPGRDRALREIDSNFQGFGPMAGNDMKAARETYQSFTTLFKYGALTCAIVALIVIWSIS
jgi:hypothetical protein